MFEKPFLGNGATAAPVRHFRSESQKVPVGVVVRVACAELTSPDVIPRVREGTKIRGRRRKSFTGDYGPPHSSPASNSPRFQTPLSG